MTRGVALAMVLAVGTAGAGVAADEPDMKASPGEDPGVGDPLEPLNRAIFDFNEVLMTLLLNPAADFYQGVFPPPVREAVGNVIQNLKSPVYLANDLLQGDVDRAQQTVTRFVVNSTWGFAGLLDRADEAFDIPSHKEDFGQTLAVWGVDEGFYLVLPVFGPSSPRDAVGKMVVDPFFDPLNWYLKANHEDEALLVRKAVEGVHELSGIKDDLQKIKATSVDYYAAIRSMYRQKRESEIRNGEVMDLPPIPDLSYDLKEIEGEDLSYLHDKK